MTTSVVTPIEITRSTCHRSTWVVAVDEGDLWFFTDKAGPINTAKRAAEKMTDRLDCEFEWVQTNADRWSLHIIEPDPF